MARNNDVDFYGELRHKTTMAYLVFDGDNEIWIPKSLVKELRRIGKGDDYEFTIPEWLAIDKGII